MGTDDPECCAASPAARDLADLRHADAWLRDVLSGRAGRGRFTEPAARDRGQGAHIIDRPHARRRWRRAVVTAMLIMSLSAGLARLSLLVAAQPIHAPRTHSYSSEHYRVP